MAKKTIKTKDPLVQKIIERIAKRSDIGIKKYGNTMETSTKPIKSWITDAQEELGDAIVYLEKVKNSLVGAKVKQHIETDKDLGGGGGYDFDKWEGTDSE